MEQLTFPVGMSAFNAVSERFVLHWNIHHLIVLKLIFSILFCSASFTCPLWRGWLGNLYQGILQKEWIHWGILWRGRTKGPFMTDFNDLIHEPYHESHWFVCLACLFDSHCLPCHATPLSVVWQPKCTNGRGGLVKCVTMLLDRNLALLRSRKETEVSRSKQWKFGKARSGIR